MKVKESKVEEHEGMMKFLAVDIGASSGRTIIGHVDGGSIRLEETHRFENSMLDLGGAKHWDAHGLIGEIRRGIDQAGKVDGIGIDTWGVDYGLIDSDGNLLDQPFAYRDARNEAAMPYVYERIAKDRLYQITGLQEMPFNTIFQIMADKINRPALLEKTEHLLFMPQLLSYMLTGVPAAEYTICSTSGLLDARERSWSKELLKILGYPRNIFGKIQMPGTQAGSYNGIPVYLPGGHDTASAVAAVPAIEGGNWAYISSGTWSLIGAELDEPILTDESAKADFTNEGGVGGTIRFLKNVNGLWLIQECRRIWAEAGTKISFEEIAAEAERTVRFTSSINPNEARFMAPKNMPAEIQAACRESGQQVPETIGELARCCYVSLAKAYRKQLQVLSHVTGKEMDRLHIVGGGCQAELLNQLTADYCGIPVIAGPVEATAIGNICIQAMANGLFSDIADVRRTIANAFSLKRYEPTTQ